MLVARAGKLLRRIARGAVLRRISTGSPTTCLVNVVTVQGEVKLPITRLTKQVELFPSNPSLGTNPF
jgi:hypothetical protein